MRDPWAVQRANQPLNPTVPLGRGLGALRKQVAAFTSRAISAPVKNTPFLIAWPVYTGTSADTFLNSPRILVPANKNRVSLSVFQIAVEPNPVPTFASSFSWGYPALAPKVGVGRAYGPLIPGYCVLPTRAIYHLGPLGNGTISEDALWVTLDKVIAGGITGYSPGFVLAYEGVLAVESERNQAA